MASLRILHGFKFSLLGFVAADEVGGEYFVVNFVVDFVVNFVVGLVAVDAWVGVVGFFLGPFF